MALLLHIETSGQSCSVALSEDLQFLAGRVSGEKNRHSQVLTLFIQEVMQEAGKSFPSLDGISVSKGPGSYTGLRIGASVAKGLAYSLDKPLISLHTLKVLAASLPGEIKTGRAILCPMMDARRMEVYWALLNTENEFIQDVKATVVDNEFVKNLPRGNKIIFFGDGMPKAKEMLQDINYAEFAGEISPMASAMIDMAFKKYNDHDFEDVAYYEPFYLKEFITGDSSAKLKRVLNKNQE